MFTDNGLFNLCSLNAVNLKNDNNLTFNRIKFCPIVHPPPHSLQTAIIILHGLAVGGGGGWRRRGIRPYSSCHRNLMGLEY
jgi:hypothetical protein